MATAGCDQPLLACHAGPRPSAIADPGRPQNQDIEVPPDPLSAGERVDGAAIEIARCAQIEILDAGRLAHAGPLQPLFELGAEHGGMLQIDEQRQAFLERHCLDIGLGHLRLQGVSHRREPQGVKFFNGLLKHGRTPQWNVPGG